VHPIYWNTVSIGQHTGYGKAGKQLALHMTKHGATWEPFGPVALNFCMPPEYYFSDFTIGYTPWETTEIPGNWKNNLMKVDDIWATSEFVAEVFRQKTKRENIFVLPHGIENLWQPKRREATEPFIFLHIGGDATRKGSEIMLQAWHKKFGGRKDCQLIFKTNRFVTARIYDKEGSIIASPSTYPNIRILDKVFTEDQMLELFYNSHCLVTTSRGEGFGLPPFEFIASGGPCILPAATGMKEFSRFGWELNNLTLVDSTNQREHPGKWLDFDVDEIIHNMEVILADPQAAFDKAFQNGKQLHEEYGWDGVAKKALQRIEQVVK